MVAVVALALAGALYAVALAALRRHDAGYLARDPAASPWWFAYARDLVNMLAFLMFSGGFALAGLPGHLALLAGATLALSAYGLDYLLARRLEVEKAGLVHGIVLVLYAAIAGLLARPLERALAAAVRGLF